MAYGDFAGNNTGRTEQCHKAGDPGVNAETFNTVIRENALDTGMSRWFYWTKNNGSFEFAPTYADCGEQTKTVVTKQLLLSAVLNEYAGGSVLGTEN